MMQNVEIKYAIEDAQGLRRLLRSLPNISFQFRHHQKDIYFATPRGRLKIRLEEERPAFLIEYHREDRAAARISDYTLRELADPEKEIARLQKEVGRLAEVDKLRELYLYKNVRIHVDEVADLGSFVEFESVISAEVKKAAAQRNLQELLAQLSDHLGTVQSTGYLNLLLQRKAEGR